MNVLVTVSTLCHIHYSVSTYVSSLGAKKGCRVGFVPLIGRPGEWLMNTAAGYAAEEQWDWWLHIDADNPPTRDPFDLIPLDKPLIVLPTPMVAPRNQPGRITKWNIWREVEGVANGQTNSWSEHRLEGLMPILWGGAGCFLAKAPLVRTLTFPLFYWEYQDERGMGLGSSPDRQWCKRWISSGHQIWTHWDYRCDHWRDNLNLRRVCELEDELERLQVCGYSSFGAQLESQKPQGLELHAPVK